MVGTKYINISLSIDSNLLLVVISAITSLLKTLKLDPKAEIKESEFFKSDYGWMPEVLDEMNYQKFRQYDLSDAKLFLICGVSTTGKDTLLAKAMEKVTNLTYIPRATSRSPRLGEKDGVNYFFNWDNPILWSEYGGNYYAITQDVLKKLSEKKRGVMIQGFVYAPAIKFLLEKLGAEVEVIYILPSVFKDGVEAALNLVKSRLPIRHGEVLKLRFPSIREELSYVFKNFESIKKAGVKIVENIPSESSYSKEAVEKLVKILND